MAVQTVLGKIEGRQLGRTLTHEHLCLDYGKFYIPAPSGLEKFLEDEISLKNVGFVQRYPYSSFYNISFNTEETKRAVLEDVGMFRSFGGGAIVENTTHGLKRDAKFLKDVSQKTGVHIIAGTGHYLAHVQSSNVINNSAEDLFMLMREELVSGCVDDPGIKCGFIGEVASDYPIRDFEWKAIQATAETQQLLKCPVSFHPGRDVGAPMEIMRLFTEAGGDSKKAVMSHLDTFAVSKEWSRSGTLKDIKQFLDLAAEYKCFLQQDLFGTEVLTYQFDPKTQMPSDAQRIDRIKQLIQNGYQDRILVSHDIHTKHRLIEFGGHGYCHLYKNVIPKMITENIPQQLIDLITIENPKNWLSWDCLH